MTGRIINTAAELGCVNEISEMMEKKVTTSKATTRARPAILRWLADDAMVLGIHLDTKLL